MSEDRKKIFIAIPSMDNVPVDFANCLAILKKPEGYDWALQFEVGSLVYVARNKLAEKAIAAGADYIFWLDSDMVFRPEVLLQLLSSMEETGADIISGLYFRRVPPHTPVLFDKLDVTDDGNICEWSEFSEVPGEPFQVGGVGFGCLLMKADICTKVQADHMKLFTPVATVGEDLAFCWRARQSGFSIYVDPRIVLGHVGRMIIDRDFFLSYQEARHERIDRGTDEGAE